MQRYDERWAAVLAADSDDDSDAEKQDAELTDARLFATECRDRGNAFAHRGAPGQAGAWTEATRKGMEEALRLYEQAIHRLAKVSDKPGFGKPDRQLLEQCRLNVATVALELDQLDVGEEAAKAALAADPKQPAAALALAAVALKRLDLDRAALWCVRTMEWAKERGDEGTRQRASDLVLRPLPSANKPWLEKQVEDGIALFKRRELTRAEKILSQVIQLLDLSTAGPLEELKHLRSIIWSLDSLDALVEIAAAQKLWPRALSVGGRALVLLEDGSGPLATAMKGEQIRQRKGYLLLSMAHARRALGEDPMSFIRRSAQAWREGTGQPLVEGKMLLELEALATSVLGGEDHSTQEALQDSVEELLSLLATAEKRFREGNFDSWAGLAQARTLNLFIRAGLSEQATAYLTEALETNETADDGKRSSSSNNDSNTDNGSSNNKSNKNSKNSQSDKSKSKSSSRQTTSKRLNAKALAIVARACPETDPPSLRQAWLQALPSFARACASLFAFEAAQSALHLQLRLAQALGDGAAEVEAEQALTILHQAHGNSDAVEQHIQKLEKWSERLGDQTGADNPVFQALSALRSVPLGSSKAAQAVANAAGLKLTPASLTAATNPASRGMGSVLRPPAGPEDDDENEDESGASASGLSEEEELAEAGSSGAAGAPEKSSKTTNIPSRASTLGSDLLAFSLIGAVGMLVFALLVAWLRSYLLEVLPPQAGAANRGQGSGG